MSSKRPARGVRRQYGLFVALPLAVLTGILSLVFAGGPVADLLSGQLNQPVHLDAPRSVAVDGLGHVYVLEASDRRLVAFTDDGRYLWSIPGMGPAISGTNGGSLDGRPDGGVVLANPDSHELLAVSASGQVEGVLVKAPESIALMSFEVRNNQLWYQTLSDRHITLRSRPLALGGSVVPERHHILFEASLPEGLDVVQAIPQLPDGLLLLDRSGWLRLLNQAGEISTPDWARSESLTFPKALRSGAEGTVLVLDVASRAVFRAESLSSPQLTTLLGQEEVLKTGRASPTWGDLAVSADGTLAAVDPFAGTIALRHTTGTTTVVSGLSLPESVKFLNGFLVILALSFVGFAAWAMGGLVRRLFEVQAPPVGKQLAIALPLLVASALVGTWNLYQGHEERSHEELRAKLTFLAAAGSASMDGDLLRGIVSVRDQDTVAYHQLQTEVNNLLTAGETAQIRAFKVVGDQFFVVVSPDGWFTPLSPWGGIGREHLAVARGGTVEYASASELPATPARALAPIRGSNGAIEGVLEVFQIEDHAGGFGLIYGMSLATSLQLSLALVLVVVLGTSLLMTRRSGPRLHREVPLADAGTMNTRQIEYFGRLKEVSTAISRFVPRELLSLLGRTRAADVQPGDHVRRSMTILWGQLPAQDDLIAIGRAMGIVGPIVRRHQGFLLRQDGDSFVVVIPGKEPEGVRVAQEVEQALTPVPGQPNVGLGVQWQTIELGLRSVGDRLAPSLVADLGSVRSQARKALNQGGGLRLAEKSRSP